MFTKEELMHMSLMTKKEKVKQIREKLMKSGLYNLPIDIIKFAKLENFKIYKASLPDDTSGVLLVDDERKIANYDTNRLIAVNDSFSAEKSRFIIAHEFAHFILHKKDNIQIAHRDYSRAEEPNEIEADEYAKLLLMPTDLILPQILAHDNCKYKAQIIDFISEACAVSQAKAIDKISDMINDGLIRFREDSSLDKEHLKKQLSIADKNNLVSISETELFSESVITNDY